MSPMNNRILRPLAVPGVLDFAPGAAAAYSLRNLSLSYASPVVTVRRSTDSAEAAFTAAEVSDGTLAAWCGGGNGFVKQWWDQSGNARHATQATASLQPRIVDSGSLSLDSNTGKPALEFRPDAATESSLSFSRLQNIRHVFAVARNDGTDVVTLMRDATSNDLRGFFMRLSPDQWNMQQIGSYPQTHGFLIQQGETHLFYVAADGTNSQYGMDGAVAAAEAETDFIAASEMGKYHIATVNMDGLVSEILLYESDQSANRQRIEGDINRHFGIF